MKNAKILLTIAVVLFMMAMTAVPLWATDYYVRTDGNDGNDGSADDAAHAWLTISSAIGQVSAGDIINVADGTYTITAAIVVSKGITITGNITTPKNVIVRYATPQTQLDGFKMDVADITIQGIKVQYCGFGFRFQRSNTATGCTITNCIITTVATGIGEVQAENTTISNNTITNCEWKGVYLRSNNASSLANRSEVTGNTFTSCNPCIQTHVGGKYCYIYNNTITSSNDKGINICSSSATSSAERIEVVGNNISGCSYASIQSVESKYVYIYDNTITSSNIEGIYIGESFATSSAERIEVVGNTISDSRYPGIMVDYSAPYTYIYNNTLTNCNNYGADGTGDWDYASIHVGENEKTPGSGTNHHTVIDNNTISDGISGIQIWSDDCTITNNTIYNMGLTYDDTKNTSCGLYYNSGILIGTNWLTNNNKPTGTTITGNDIHDNHWGLYVRDYANLSPLDPDVLNVTATHNWWGNASGPSGEGYGTGDAVSTSVDYKPWYSDQAMTTTMTTSLFTSPATELMKGSEMVTYSVNIDSVAAMRGFTIQISYSTSDFSSAILHEGSFLSGPGIQTVFDQAGSAGSYVAEWAVCGDTSASGSGNLFTIDLTTAADVNNLTGSALTLTSVSLRDVDNQEITCGGTTGAIITIDFSPPTMDPIAEPQGVYYNTDPAPQFENLGFDDNYDLNDIDYKISAGWTTFTNNVSGSSYDQAPWSVPGFAELSEGTNTVYWRADDDAGNQGGYDESWNWQFYKDTEAPAGTMGITFSNVAIDSMYVTGAVLTDATQGDEYYEFDCTTDAYWDRVRLIDDNVNECTGMTANTQYAFKYQVSDTVINYTVWSDLCSTYTLSVPPTEDVTVTCDKDTSTWYITPTFTFTAVGAGDGFGAGYIEYYRYAWDQIATYSWTGSETEWTTSTLPKNATEPGNNWYLHLKGYNGDGVENGTVDLGPYYFDAGPPDVVTGVTATPVAGGVSLSWTEVAHANIYEFVRLEIRRTAWGGDDYPTYPTASEPSYPTNTGGTLDTTITAGVATSSQDIISGLAEVTRNIYYYQLFVYDAGENVSPCSTSAQARATNYLLGDIRQVGGENPFPYNNSVDYEDLVPWSVGYGSSTGEEFYNAEFDIGPTHNGHRLGIPQPWATTNHLGQTGIPANTIQFEDLMIFAMNYNRSLAKSVPPVITPPAEELAFVLDGMVSRAGSDDRLSVTLRLDNDGQPVKGANLALTYDASCLELLEVVSGGLFEQQGQPEFFHHADKDGRLDISAAILGTDVGITSSGDLALLKFKVLKVAEGSEIGFDEVSLRDAENESLEPLAKSLSLDSIIPPITYKLAQNYPNPFNPMTTIKYQLPEKAAVVLSIYNTLGQKVRVLVNERKESGYHAVVWDSRDDQGRPVSSGLYFYNIRADKFTRTHKMLFLK